MDDMQKLAAHRRAQEEAIAANRAAAYHENTVDSIFELLKELNAKVDALAAKKEKTKE